MNNSVIMSDVKNNVGLYTEDETFDQQLIMFTNSVFSELFQILFREEGVFSIQTGEEIWSDYTTDTELLGLIPDFVCAKVRRKFNPPNNSTLLKALDESIDESTWRINNYT